MNLKASISLYAGGPGSGCRGDNCGRKAGAKVLETTELKSTDALKSKLLELSKGGGAYVAHVVFGSTAIYRYDSPSKIPDHFIERNPWGIAYNGKFVPFSKAAQIREQNRGYSGDR